MIKKLLLIILLSISAFGDFENTTFLRENAKEVVINSFTGLMWQDDSRAKNVEKDWSDAKVYCQNLVHAGYDDWYLPSISELETLVDTKKQNPAIKKGFENVSSSFYWSSSSDVSDSHSAWYVYFKPGYIDSYDKSDEYNVRCVRVGQ
ncbi:MAG: hypothetical protein ACJAWW_001542 [Sulfurimonas sp.]|jgi:hypothetical protein